MVHEKEDHAFMLIVERSSTSHVSMYSFVATVAREKFDSESSKPEIARTAISCVPKPAALWA